jgi:DNA-binding CsgD family transcriptional regulator
VVGGSLKNDSVAAAVHSRPTLPGEQQSRRHVPWRAICAFLEAIESESTPEGFFRRTLERLETLVSYDHGIAEVSDANLQGRPMFTVRRSVSVWAHGGHGNDFFAPEKPRHSISIGNGKESGAYGFAISLHRHGGQGFSVREQRVLEILNAHLRNLFRGLMEPLGLREGHLLEAASRAGLSLRERQIYLLLCKRLTIAEIAQRLYISRHTVAKHIEHIYDKLLVSGRRGACAHAEPGS